MRQPKFAVHFVWIGIGLVVVWACTHLAAALLAHQEISGSAVLEPCESYGAGP